TEAAQQRHQENGRLEVEVHGSAPGSGWRKGRGGSAHTTDAVVQPEDVSHLRMPGCEVRLRRIRPGDALEDLESTRMQLQPSGEIVDLAVDDHPQALGRGVASDLVHGNDGKVDRRRLLRMEQRP